MYDKIYQIVFQSILTLHVWIHKEASGSVKLMLNIMNMNLY